MNALTIESFSSQEDIDIGNAIIIMARKNYLNRIKKYLIIGSIALLAGRLLGPLMPTINISIFINFTQAICLGFVFYAIWQLITPRSKQFRRFQLPKELVTELKNTLTPQGWQILLNTRNKRKFPDFCVADILLAVKQI